MARVIVADGDVLRERLATYVSELSAASTKPRFVVALSGGSMPKLLSGLLDKGIDWASWDVFFADERCVPADSDDSNLKACTEALFDKIAAQKPRIHALDVRRGARHRWRLRRTTRAARRCRSARRRPPRPTPELAARGAASGAATRASRRCGGFFDLALLGMGPDGHTASLFPGHPEMDRADGAVAAVVADSPKPPPERVTRVDPRSSSFFRATAVARFTLKTLREARHVAFVCTGASKAKVVAEIMRLSPDAQACAYADPPAPYPAARVRAADGAATWFLDGGAASGFGGTA
ncbi:6-phosphogluconolactonase [Aureococcus anophagefferens]|nr:6-phosphogluconolactonase [Aureococcus anophagefferens]